MTRLLMIFDTWVMMAVATLFLWFGMTGIRAGNIAGSDVAVGFIGGIAGVCSAGLLCGWRGHWTQPALILLRLVMIACFAYFVWFQERPWFALDDSTLVRGSFRQEFFRQRLEQMGGFLLIVVPMLALGIWHGQILPEIRSRQLGGRNGVSLLVGLVGASVIAGVAARLAGVPTLGPMFWTISTIAVVLILFEFARRVNRAEFPAFVAFAVFVIAIPVVLLWP